MIISDAEIILNSIYLSTSFGQTFGRPLFYIFIKNIQWFPQLLMQCLMQFSSSCTIDWKKGKNVTVKVIKKKQKHKGKLYNCTMKTLEDGSIYLGREVSPPPPSPDKMAWRGGLVIFHKFELLRRHETHRS